MFGIIRAGFCVGSTVADGTNEKVFFWWLAVVVGHVTIRSA